MFSPEDFCPSEIFFFVLVGRYSANFAPARPRKSFAARRLGHGSEAKLTEFRPGGGAKLSAGGAKRAESRELGAKSGVRARQRMMRHLPMVGGAHPTAADGQMSKTPPHWVLSAFV